MSAEANDLGLSSVYPAPPYFYKFFTRENRDRLECLKKEALNNKTAESTDTIETIVANKLAAEDSVDNALKYLIPPSVPDAPAYRSFGNIWPVNDRMVTLKEMGIEKLYKLSEEEDDKEPLDNMDALTEGSHGASHERIDQIKYLLKSLLINFLDLVGIMSISPESFPGKVEDIRVILINMHHLLNEYRPHQSRESLILLMEEQIEKKKKEIDHIKSTYREVQKQISTISQSIPNFEHHMSPEKNSPKDIDDINDDLKQQNLEAGKPFYPSVKEFPREGRDSLLWNIMNDV